MIKVKSKKILAIDYGRSKLGLAIASTPLAEPYRVVRYKKDIEVIEKIAEVLYVEKIEEIVLGVSEGKIAEETKEFGKKLEEMLKIPVVYQDETLSTQLAQELSIKSGMNRKKRKLMEDAFAACLILQNYIDRNTG